MGHSGRQGCNASGEAGCDLAGGEDTTTIRSIFQNADHLFAAPNADNQKSKSHTKCRHEKYTDQFSRMPIVST